MYLNGFRNPKRTRAIGSRRTPEVRERAEIARRFYCDLLGGRQVWQAERRAAPDVLWFRVGTSLIEVAASRCRAAEPIEIPVESPLDVAAQCWDGGSTVRLHAGAGDDRVSVTDPFGREITLVRREANRWFHAGRVDETDRLHLSGSGA